MLIIRHCSGSTSFCSGIKVWVEKAMFPNSYVVEIREGEEGLGRNLPEHLFIRLPRYTKTLFHSFY
jgi:hypothetical protein